MGVHHEYFDQAFVERRQKRYAVVLFLPAHFDEIIMPIRERFDPLYNLVPSHVSLVFPFDWADPLDDLTGRVQKVCEKFHRFSIEVDSVGDFYPKFPVIYWGIKQNQQLHEMYHAFYAALDRRIPYQTFMPHVTVAREISEHRVFLVKDSIIPYLPHEKIEVTKVDLITPLSGYKWVSVRTFLLSN